MSSAKLSFGSAVAMPFVRINPSCRRRGVVLTGTSFANGWYGNVLILILYRIDIVPIC